MNENNLSRTCFLFARSPDQPVSRSFSCTHQRQDFLPELRRLTGAGSSHKDRVIAGNCPHNVRPILRIQHGGDRLGVARVRLEDYQVRRLVGFAKKLLEDNLQGGLDRGRRLGGIRQAVTRTRFDRPNSSISRDTVACVTWMPRRASFRRNSSWVAAGSVRRRFRI